ncbi:MAG: peptidoglycan D,D-transpeptidase FtsI family protein [Saezia sp.]
MSNHGVYYTKSPLLASRTPVWRSRFIIFCIAVGFMTLIARASWVQLFDYGHLQEEADKRYVRTLQLPASRGEIHDRSGATLASSIEMPSLWASPIEVNMTDVQLTALAHLLGESESSLKAKLDAGAERNREFVWLKRWASEELAEQVLALEIKGVRTQNEYRRHYPDKEVTAHVLGFTDIEDHGQEGVELAFDSVLQGQLGQVQYVRDRLGNYVAGVEGREDPSDGKNVQLSIDRRIQYFAYDTLKKTVRDLQAKSGSAVVIDTQTGEILALVNYPSYDPSAREDLKGASLRNSAVTDIFEPGSTIKPIIIAKALDLGLVEPTTMINTTRGSLVVGDFVIRDVGNYRQLTVQQVVQKSSNIGVVRIAMQMKPQEMWEVFKGLGFGEKVQIGFPGEAKGVLRSYQSWRPIEQATQAYGYGLSVSLLQLTQAYTVFARDGEMIPLTLLRNETPVTGVRVFSSKAAEQVREMLHMSAAEGAAGGRARITGYSVGGKSGTVIQSQRGGYASARYRAWYVGLAPINNPRLVVGILIDDPSKDRERGGYYGGVAAAPAFSKIMEHSLWFMGVVPDLPVHAAPPPPENRNRRRA